MVGWPCKNMIEQRAQPCIAFVVGHALDRQRDNLGCGGHAVIADQLRTDLRRDAARRRIQSGAILHRWHFYAYTDHCRNPLA